MKSYVKKIIIIVTLGLLFPLSNLINYNLIDNQEVKEDDQETRLRSPKSSAGYIETYIYIDGNWTDAIGKGWFSGEGSRGSPYVIENVTINASTSPTGSGIFINNSKNDYFIIRNVTVYNAASGSINAGIKLQNTNNGTLINNNCSNNERYGIYLRLGSKNNNITGNTANNNYAGIRLYQSSNNNTISGNTANNNSYSGIYLSQSSNNNTISGNTASNNTIFGIYLATDCSNNNISGNTANNNDDDGIFLDRSNNNTISGNTANNNDDDGIRLDQSSNNNVSGNTANNNTWAGIGLKNNCDDNNISGNFIYFNEIGVYIVDSDCNDNIISRNIMVSSDEKFIDSSGTNTIIKSNYFGMIPPSFIVETIDLFFSTTEFIVTIKVSSQCEILEVSELSIQVWWNGILIPLENITVVGNIYNISLTLKFVGSGDDPIRLNMTISAPYHVDKYYELNISVYAVETVVETIVEIVVETVVETLIPTLSEELFVNISYEFFSTENFTIIFQILNSDGVGIENATIQVMWNGVNKSSSVQGLDSGVYKIILNPILVNPGDDPILLNMTIKAVGYDYLYYELDLAVDPAAVDKTSPPPSDDNDDPVPGGASVVIIIVISISIAAVIAIVGIAFGILRKRKQVREDI